MAQTSSTSRRYSVTNYTIFGFFLLIVALAGYAMVAFSQTGL